jgi:hypothetical protein
MASSSLNSFAAFVEFLGGALKLTIVLVTRLASSGDTSSSWKASSTRSRVASSISSLPCMLWLKTKFICAYLVHVAIPHGKCLFGKGVSPSFTTKYHPSLLPVGADIIAPTFLIYPSRNLNLIPTAGLVSHWCTRNHSSSTQRHVHTTTETTEQHTLICPRDTANIAPVFAAENPSERIIVTL